MKKKKQIQISDTWFTNPIIPNFEELGLSTKQKKLLTPVLVNSVYLEGLRRSFVELYKKTRHLYSPLTFRYSFANKVSGNRQVTAVPLYYLEKELNYMYREHGIFTDTTAIKYTGAAWELEASELIMFFDTDCKEAVHKLVKTEVSDGRYLGWEMKEIFKDLPVR